MSLRPHSCAKLIRARIGRLAALAVLGGAGAGVGLLALGPEDFLIYSTGPLTLKPQLDFSTTFDDNVSYRPSNTDSDVILMTAPGFGLELGRPETSYTVAFNYALSRYVYVDTSQYDHTDHHLDLSGKVKGEKWSIANRAAADFFSGLITGSSSLNESGGLNSLGRKVDRWVVADEFRLEYQATERIGTYGQARYQSTDYETGMPLFDQTSLTGTLGAAYAAFSKSLLFAEAYVGQIATRSNSGLGKSPDLDSVGGFLGFKGELSPRLLATIQAGVETRSLDNGTSPSVQPVVQGMLNYAPTEKLGLSLGYSRSTGVSVEASAYTFTSDALSFRINQKLGNRDKWSVSLEGRGRWDSYDPGSGNLAREDTYYSAILGLNYMIQDWLRATVSYSHENLSNEISGASLDYVVNRATLQFSVGY